MPRKKPKSESVIAWITITYRSVAIAAFLLLLLAGFVVYLVLPESKAYTQRVWQSALSRVDSSVGSTDKFVPGKQQAHFTAIDGRVRVKKADSNTWVAADYSLPLEKGDVVQTTSEGMAKVVFADGTNYTIKQDSLIVVEENSANAQQQTHVAVQVTTGTVDLTTATFAQGSKNQVIVSGATASLAPESAAMVRSDPTADQHEVLLKKGSGEVLRNGELVRLTDFEKVSFKSESAKMLKEKEIGPPTLIAPANMAPILAPGSQPLGFSWSPVGKVNTFHIRISRNPYFSSTVFDRVVQGTQVQVAGLSEGPYYWVVQTVGPEGKQSVESEKNRFTVIPKAKQEASIALELQPLVQHGHVIEVQGRTEPAARVMVNGQEVPIVTSDGSFHYFTPPLPNGESLITVTAQNARGGVNTQQKRVVIQ
ncbi:MAG TPA: hypothetical protein VES66_04860 [Terriglobales bacterium]|nr:hypothetical protein [Terriglobales bacterium]